jgi:hypothetical protein
VPSKCEAKCCPFLSFSPSEYEAQEQKISIFQLKKHIFFEGNGRSRAAVRYGGLKGGIVSAGCCQEESGA